MNRYDARNERLSALSSIDLVLSDKVCYFSTSDRWSTVKGEKSTFEVAIAAIKSSARVRAGVIARRSIVLATRNFGP